MIMLKRVWSFLVLGSALTMLGGCHGGGGNSSASMPMGGGTMMRQPVMTSPMPMTQTSNNGTFRDSNGRLHSANGQFVAEPHNAATSFAARHKTALSIAGGVAAYHAAKVTGQNREAAGGNKNFMQRHPILTGLGAAALTHHTLGKIH